MRLTVKKYRQITPLQKRQTSETLTFSKKVLHLVSLRRDAGFFLAFFKAFFSLFNFPSKYNKWKRPFFQHPAIIVFPLVTLHVKSTNLGLVHLGEHGDERVIRGFFKKFFGKSLKDPRIKSGLPDWTI